MSHIPLFRAAGADTVHDRPDEMSYWEILHIFYSKRNMTLNTHTFHQFYHEMSTDALKLVTRLVVDLE